MKKYIVSLLSFFFLISCGTVEKKNEPIIAQTIVSKSTYIIQDASLKLRPVWINSPEAWAKESGESVKGHAYFSFETPAKVSKKIACSVSRANVKLNVGEEIASFLNKRIEVAIDEGAEGNPELEVVKQYIESSLAQNIQEQISRVSIIKNYWEKRHYKLELGSQRDFSAYTCAVLVSVDDELIKNSINEAVRLILSQTDDEVTQSSIEELLESSDDLFIKYKQLSD